MRMLYICISVACACLTFGCKPGPPLIQTDLYFGCSKADGSIIDDSVASDFVDRHAGVAFKKGYTLIFASGKWYDATAQVTYSEPSFIVTSSDTMTDERSAGIDSLRELYKREFQQSSVLRVDKEISKIDD